MEPIRHLWRLTPEVLEYIKALESKNLLEAKRGTEMFEPRLDVAQDIFRLARASNRL